MKKWSLRTTIILAIGLVVIIALAVNYYNVRRQAKSGEINVAQVARHRIYNQSMFWGPPKAKVVWQLEGWQLGVVKPDFNKWLVETVTNEWKWLYPDLRDRQPLGAVSYVSVVQSSHNGQRYINTIELPYTGQYDHGAYFEPPSEFLLSVFGLENVITEYDDGTICINPSRNPTVQEPSWGGIVNLWLGKTNSAWPLGYKRTAANLPRECEVYLDKETGKVVKERMVFPFNNSPSKITCDYEYGGGPFPTGFTLTHEFNASAKGKLDNVITNITKAKCGVIGGLWFITSYEVVHKDADSEMLFPEYAVTNKDIKITPLTSGKDTQAK